MRKFTILFTTLSFWSFGNAFTQEAPSQSVGVARLTPEVRSAISKGLEYLAKDDLQRADGSWGGDQNRVAETSLTLMAFMLQGHVPGRGQYGRAMENAISFLLNVGQNQRGYLGTPRNHAGMYEHGLAVLALSEAWGQSKNPRIKSALTRAVDITLRAQNREGGWRYSPEPRDADLSMTVMQLVALNSASEAGIAVPQATIDKAAEYVISCQDLSSGGFKYTPGGGEPNFARTAAGVMSLIMCGQRDQKPTQRSVRRYVTKFFEARYSRCYISHPPRIAIVSVTSFVNFLEAFDCLRNVSWI